jgi:hypothetical protein
MRLTTRIGSKLVAVNCQGALRPQCKWLLGYLRETFSPKVEQLRDGFKLQVGWSTLCLREQDGELLVCEPDYRGDPFTRWHDDITSTLTVQAQQNDILKQTGAEGVAALFQHKIVLANGCLAEQRIYLHRTKGSPPGDSGWYVGPVTKSKDQPVYEAMYVYQLLQQRPALLQVLALPPGFMVIFDGDKIEGWRSGED